MDEIDMDFHDVQFNGSFIHENVYRQDAGPDADMAWEALGVGCELLDLYATSGANIIEMTQLFFLTRLLSEQD